MSKISLWRAVSRMLQVAGAIFLSAGAGDAQSMSVFITGPGTNYTYNGTTVAASPTGAGTVPALATGGTLTISGGPIVNTLPANNFIIVLGQSANVINNGNLSVINTSNQYLNYVGPIYLTGSSGASSVVNSGTLSASTVGQYNTGAAIYASDSGTVVVTNSGTASSTGSYAQTINAYGTSGSTILNTGQVFAGAPGNVGNFAEGLLAGSSSGSTFINNTGDVTALGNVVAEGISGSGAAAMTIQNSGNVNVSGPNDSLGISATGQNGSAPVQVTNSSAGVITVSAIGQYAGATGIQVTTSSSGMTYPPPASGAILVNNAGTINVSNPDPNQYVYGIYAGGQGGAAVTVNNSGTITSSTTGIYLTSAGTVNDSGTIMASTYAIQVPTQSRVSLTGHSPLSGLMQGGTSASSTSTLDFALTIPTGYAQAKAALDAAIANYAQAYTAAAGSGTVTSNVVVLNGSDYQWANFETVLDDLVGRSYAATPGFQSMGLVLDGLDPSNSKAAVLLNALGGLPTAYLPSALAELSPKPLQLFRNVAFDNNTFGDSQLDNHLANLRDGMTGLDSSAITVNDPGTPSLLSQLDSHLVAYDPVITRNVVNDSTQSIFGATDPKDLKAAPVNAAPVERWSSFVAGDVVLADLNNANLEDSNYTTGSVTAGVDYRLDAHFTVGALLGYAHTDADLDNHGSSATVDSYSPGLYASYVNGGWYANGLGVYTRNAYTDDRNVDIPGLAGNNQGATDGNQGAVDLTGGYEFQKGDFRFGPVLHAQYVRLSIQSLHEQGPTALDIGAQDEDSFRTQLGFEGRFNARLNTPMGPLLLTPHVSASWQHECLDDGQGITSQFNGTGGGSFITQTDNPDRDSAFIDAGLDAKVSETVTLFVGYGVQVGQADFFAQSAEGGLRIGF